MKKVCNSLKLLPRSLARALCSVMPVKAGLPPPSPRPCARPITLYPSKTQLHVFTIEEAPVLGFPVIAPEACHDSNLKRSLRPTAKHQAQRHSSNTSTCDLARVTSASLHTHFSETYSGAILPTFPSSVDHPKRRVKIHHNGSVDSVMEAHGALRKFSPVGRCLRWSGASPRGRSRLMKGVLEHACVQLDG
jgi:hypothetical protein